MKVFLIVLLIISGVLFSGSVMLQSPKGGLGFAIGGMGHANEYGSKKSLEATLKKVAMISGIVFLVVAVILPYVIA